MKRNIFFFLFLTLIMVACKHQNKQSTHTRNDTDKNIVNIEETIQKKTERIIYLEDNEQTLVRLMSNVMMNVDWSVVDTLELWDRNETLFHDLHKLLETAQIDSVLKVGPIWYERNTSLTMTVHNGENDIPADCMLIYLYSGEVSNDTICFESISNIVRVNSYIATVDSVLFKSITDTLRNRMDPHRLKPRCMQRTK